MQMFNVLCLGSDCFYKIYMYILFFYIRQQFTCCILVFVWVDWHLVHQELLTEKNPYQVYCTSVVILTPSFPFSPTDTLRHTALHKPVKLKSLQQLLQPPSWWATLHSPALMAVLLVPHGGVTQWLAFDVSHLVVSHNFLCQISETWIICSCSLNINKKKHKHIKHKLNYVSSYSCGLRLT